MLAAAGLLGGLGALGSIGGGLLSGISANKGQQRAIDAQKEQYGQNAMTLYDMLSQLLGTSYLTPGAKAKIAEIDAQEARLGPNITAAQRQQFDAQRRNARYHATLWHGASPDLSGSSFDALRGKIGEEKTARLGEYDTMTGGIDALEPEARARLMSSLSPITQSAQSLMAAAGELGPAARAAAQTGHDRSVASGEAQIAKSSAARGVRGSSAADNASIALRGQAAGGLANALAGIEAQGADLKQRAGLAGLGAAQDVANRTAGFELGEVGRRRQQMLSRFGLSQDFGNQSLDTYRQGTGLATSLINPNYAYSSINYPQSISGNVGQNLGNALGGIGGQFLGQGSQLGLMQALLSAGIFGGGGGGFGGGLPNYGGSAFA